MKDDKTVIREFNNVVNMTVPDLEKWLKSADSKQAGWSKDDGGGESIGHDSGRRIIEILKANPEKKPNQYSDEQIQHMRKVVSYCNRHIAQEQQSLDSKPIEEAKKTKSYASLKNWGHDPLKRRESSGKKTNGDSNSVEDDPQPGDKRKKSSKTSNGNKKQETNKGESIVDGEEEDQLEFVSEDDEGEDDDELEIESLDDEGDEEVDEEELNELDEEGDDDVDDYDDDGGRSDEEKGNKKTSKKGPKPGDTVSWNWGGGQPEGKVLDVKEKDASVTTKRGNKASRKGDPDDPAVVLDTGKSKAIKLDHELND